MSKAKKVTIGVQVSHQINNVVGDLSKRFAISRSAIVQRILCYIAYYNSQQKNRELLDLMFGRGGELPKIDLETMFLYIDGGDISAVDLVESDEEGSALLEEEELETV